MTERLLEVVFTRRAERHAETVDRWWRENRRGAPDLFKRELARALEVIAAAPAIGSPRQVPGSSV